MTTLTVGAGQQYQTIAAAVAASKDGDVIQIQAGTYVNDFTEISKKITLQGVNGMAKLVATQPIPNGKAILITDTDVTIDHLEFSGATVKDANGAGIRYQAGSLTITNSSFHDNQNGLLAADNPSGSITIKTSEFYNNGVGGDGHTHNLYVGDIGNLTVDGSYFHGAIIGHEIKSRAESTSITNSRIQDGAGTTASYEIDLPNGGKAVMSNNVIEKSAASQNPVIISYGEEGNLRTNSSLLVSDNTIINDQSSRSNVAVKNASSASATLSNNKVFGLASNQILSGPGTISGVVSLVTEPVLNLAGAILGTVTATPTPTPTSTPSTPTPTPAPVTTATGSATPANRLVVNVSEDAWQGDAQYTIQVDGKQIGGVRTAIASHAAGKTEAVSVDTTLSPGPHSVAVSFLNDAWGGTASTDRNLYVDKATLNGQTIAGSTATMLWSSTSSFDVTIPSVPVASSLLLRVSEDAWQGNAQFTIAIDGQAVGGVMTATASHAAGQTQAVRLNPVLAAGNHTVAISFLNDAYAGTASTDRNLYLDNASLNGAALPGSSITMYSQGTYSFNMIVPAS